ncbi:MAG TPA: HEAT repeat domain-containing protein [Nocardioidaceae bacterium]|nr:HEAT repeat domain-containing protein [Nocardioidaceae bacterium]
MIAEAVDDYGIHAVIDMCLALLEGNTDYELLPLPLSYLGGAQAVSALGRDPHLAAREQNYWPRVWAARGLRYVWMSYAEPGVVAALRDPAWRVREMAAKVVAQRELSSAADALVPLLTGSTARARVAAIRAIGLVGRDEHAELIADLDANETTVRIALEGARRRLRLRLARAR